MTAHTELLTVAEVELLATMVSFLRERCRPALFSMDVLALWFERQQVGW